ncbi:MAG: class I SAM-dependent methyltransferase [Steroidobacteraceae bacterium]
MNDSAESRERYDTLWRNLWANTHSGGPMARSRYRLALKWLGFGPQSRDRMLDVGAGNGAFMVEALARSRALDIFGAEFSQSAIDIAHPGIRERLATCDLQGSQPLPWGGEFQVITCMEVLEHLPNDAVALDHMCRALAPSGRLFVSVPAWEAHWGPQDVTAGHVRRYEPHALRELLERAGLKVLRMQCWGGPVAWAYLRAADVIGPERVMSVRPIGPAGMMATALYQLLKLDDHCSFPRGPQLFALAWKDATGSSV